MALGIVFLVTSNTSNAIVPLPVAWAYYTIFKAEDSIVALVGVFILVVMAIYQIYKNKYSLQKISSNFKTILDNNL